MDSPLSPSPLRIVRHEFLEISLKASTIDNPSDPLVLGFKREWASAEKDPCHWRMALVVKFGARDGKSPYAGQLQIEGEFQISEAYPEEKRSDLIKVTGASILYGACREMLANLTARSTHGIVSLPSVSFVEPLQSEKKAVKKAVSKKVK